MDQLLRATARAEAHHFWFRGFRWFVTPLLRRALGRQPHARILDCGCGTGANLEMLSAFGVPYGFDISEVGLYIGRKMGRKRLTRASVTAAPYGPETFDLVASFDVLYSLSDDDEATAVREMFRLTRPGGYALINVAAMEVLRGDHSVLSHELRRYDPPRLRRVLTAAGFEIVRLTHTNLSLFAPMLAVRALHRRRGLSAETEAEQEIAIPPAPLNALLSVILYLESWWLHLFDSPVGSSLLCLARKPGAEITGLPDAART